MSEEQIIDKGEILGLTTEIVSSHVSNNPVAASDLPGLIEVVYSKLSALGGAAKPEEVDLVPAVSIKKLITDDYI